MRIKNSVVWKPNFAPTRILIPLIYVVLWFTSISNFHIPNALSRFMFVKICEWVIHPKMILLAYKELALTMALKKFVCVTCNFKSWYYLSLWGLWLWHLFLLTWKSDICSREGVRMSQGDWGSWCCFVWILNGPLIFVSF